MNFKDLILQERFDSNTAVIYREKHYSYKTLREESTIIADKLASIVGDNKHNIGILMSNCDYLLIGYLGIIYSDNIIVPMGADITEEEFVSTVAYCGIDLILVNNDSLDSVRNLSLICSDLIIYNIESRSVYGEMTRSREVMTSACYDIEMSDVLILIHTSGTTNAPKRVMLTCENLLANTKGVIQSLGLSEDDITLVVLPLYLASALSQLITHLLIGAATVIYDGIFTAKKCCDLVNAYTVTNMAAVTFMVKMLLNYKRKLKDSAIPSLRKVYVGGGAVPIETAAAFDKHFPTVELIIMYGQTEAAPRATHLFAAERRERPGSVGKAIPGVALKIDGNRECGEVLIRGSNVMKGYYKCMEQTNQVIIDGWLHTGDLGMIDEEGYLYLKGRKKNIIICGGINIYPEEIEDMIMRMDGVKSAYVYPRTHETLGEVPCADLILEKPVSTEEIKAYCRSHLSWHKIPQRMNIVDEFELTKTGKIKRHTNTKKDENYG